MQPRPEHSQFVSFFAQYFKGEAMFLGLRTAIYNAPDIEKAKAWYSEVLGIEPYFAEPFYVGFNVGGFELGLQPDAGFEGLGGSVAYWGVADADAAFERLLGLGATTLLAVQEVGGGIKVAIVRDPFGNALGIIENPHFQLPTS
jgi:predicted enzyme related to lactoylglutathione lyase